LQEAAVAELLLAEVGLYPAELVLQAGQRHRTAVAGHVLDHGAQQLERLLLVSVLRKGDLGVALGGALGQLDDVASGEMPQELAEGAEAVVGFAEGGVLPEQGALQ